LAHEIPARNLVGVGDQADASDLFTQLFQSMPKTPCCPQAPEAAIL
jgi:hypothetical protein